MKAFTKRIVGATESRSWELPSDGGMTCKGSDAQDRLISAQLSHPRSGDPSSVLSVTINRLRGVSAAAVKSATKGQEIVDAVELRGEEE
jgi:hypothetical protein